MLTLTRRQSHHCSNVSFWNQFKIITARYTWLHAQADLGGAAKQLTQDAFLDIIQLPDAGSYAGCQLVIDVWVSTQSLQTHKMNWHDNFR